MLGLSASTSFEKCGRLVTMMTRTAPGALWRSATSQMGRAALHLGMVAPSGLRALGGGGGFKLQRQPPAIAAVAIATAARVPACSAPSTRSLSSSADTKDVLVVAPKVQKPGIVRR